MANTFSQIHIHIVLAVADRDRVISKKIKEKVEKYITGIISGCNQKPLAVNCMPDHTHILVGLRPSCRISDLVRDIKHSGSTFINQNRLVAGRFRWQEGYGVFSCSKASVKNVINYILTQEEHHKINSFREEYLRLLAREEVDYDPRYLFDWL